MIRKRKVFVSSAPSFDRESDGNGTPVVSKRLTILEAVQKHLSTTLKNENQVLQKSTELCELHAHCTKCTSISFTNYTLKTKKHSSKRWDSLCFARYVLLCVQICALHPKEDTDSGPPESVKFTKRAIDSGTLGKLNILLYYISADILYYKQKMKPYKPNFLQIYTSLWYLPWNETS